MMEAATEQMIQKGEDDARKPYSAEVLNGKETTPCALISRLSASPAIINTKIHINSTDYLQPLPALDHHEIGIPHHQYRTLRNAQQGTGIHNVQLGTPPNSGITP